MAGPSYSRFRAYPRMRGGNNAEVFLNRVIRGLSPHARGKRTSAAIWTSTWGPIPACAGETILVCLRMAHLRAYPRMRGGN